MICLYSTNVIYWAALPPNMIYPADAGCDIFVALQRMLRLLGLEKKQDVAVEFLSAVGEFRFAVILFR